jgi:hypothetical protein
MEQIITKLEAAKRQLNCALELFFDEKDTVSIHTLACAAHQVIYDINRDQNGPELLFDYQDTSDSNEKVTKKLLHSQYNFFKHADNDPCPNCGIRFSSDISEIFLLSSVIGIYYLEGTINGLQRAFINYIHVNNGDFLSQDIVEYLKSKISDESKTKLKGMGKREFLKEYLGKKWGHVLNSEKY